MMPEMTGLQLHAELKNSQAEIPIIVVTGYADAQTCRTALHNGVFDFVEKSFNPHDLLVVIQSAIEENTRKTSERTGASRRGHDNNSRNLSRREGEVMKLLVTGPDSQINCRRAGNFCTNSFQTSASAIRET